MMVEDTRIESTEPDLNPDQLRRRRRWQARSRDLEKDP